MGTRILVDLVSRLEVRVPVRACTETYFTGTTSGAGHTVPAVQVLPRLFVEDWAPDPSGLVLPLGARASIVEVGTPVFATSREALWIASRERVDEVELLIRKVAAEEQMGLVGSTMSDLVALVTALPFEWSIQQLAVLHTIVARLPSTATAHLHLAGQLFGPGQLFSRFEQLVHQGYLLFAPQHVFLLTRVVMEYADSRLPHSSDPALPELLRARFLRALLATTSLVHANVDREDVTVTRMLAVMLQSTSFHFRADLMSAMVRARVLIDGSRPAIAHADWLPLRWWLHEESGGVPAESQLAAGFALAGLLSAFDDEPVEGDIVGFVDEAQVRSTFAQAGIHGHGADYMLSTLTRTRGEFVAAYRQRGTDETAMVYDRGPLDETPFLRTDDGRLLLLNPDCLANWLTTGFERRLERLADRHGQRRTFRNMVGRVIENYALQLCTASIRSVGQPRVTGDITYRTASGQRKSPDIAIDCRPDLVLIEVVSGNLHFGTTVAGEVSNLETDLERLLVGKVRQLYARIDDTLLQPEPLAASKHMRYFGVERSAWRRIFPVIVTTQEIVESWLLYRYLRDKTMIDEAGRVQRLTLLDLPGLELLMGIVEGGAGLTEILSAKAASAFATLELQQWVERQPGAPPRRRPEFVEKHWNHLMADNITNLGLDPLGIHAQRLRDGTHPRIVEARAMASGSQRR